MLSTILLELSHSIGTLFREKTQLQGLEYDHEFEVMRRFLAMFLMQTDPSFNQQVDDLRNLLENPFDQKAS